MNYIYAGMVARMADGATAPVRGVLLDPSTNARVYVVLGANGLLGPDVVVPYAAVWLVDDDLHLSLTGAEVAALPAFHRHAPTPARAPSSEPSWRYVHRRRPLWPAHAALPR